MRIAAHHGHAGQRCALLRADDMHDTLAHICHLEFGDTQFFTILIERFHLQTRNGIGDALRATGSRHVVICHRQHGINAPRLASGQTQALEGLRAGHFMHQMAVYVDQRGAVGFLTHYVAVPDFVVKSTHACFLFQSTRLCHIMGRMRHLAGLLPACHWQKMASAKVWARLNKVRQSTDGTTSHSTKRAKYARLVAGYTQQAACGIDTAVPLRHLDSS